MVCETKINFKEERIPECQVTRFNITVDVSDEDLDMLYDPMLYDPLYSVRNSHTDEERLIALSFVISSIKTHKRIIERIQRDI